MLILILIFVSDMDKENLKSAALAITSAYALYNLWKYCQEIASRKRIEKKRLMDIVGNTPLIYIESLS